MRNRYFSLALATVASGLLFIPTFVLAIAPSVFLLNPPNNTFLNAGDVIKLQANASDPDGTVLKVEFYQDGLLRGEAAPAPFQIYWSNAVAGTYQLSAVAVDDALERATSAVVSVTVSGSATPQTLVWNVPFSPAGYEWNRTAVNWRLSSNGRPAVFHDGDTVLFQGGPPGSIFIGLDGVPTAVSPAAMTVQTGGLGFHGGDILTGSINLGMGAGGVFSNAIGSLSFPGGTIVQPMASGLTYDVSSAPNGASVHFGTGPITLGAGFSLQMGSNRVVTLENDFVINPQGNAVIHINPASKLNGVARFSGSLSLSGVVNLNIYGMNGSPNNPGDGAPHEWAGPVVLDQSASRTLRLATQPVTGYQTKGLLVSGNISDGPGSGTNRLQLVNGPLPFIRLTGSNSYANGTLLDYSPGRFPVEVGPSSTLGRGDVEVGYGAVLRLMGSQNIHSNASVLVRGQVMLDRGVKVRLRALTLLNTTYTNGLFTSTNPAAYFYLLSNGTFRLPATNLLPAVALAQPVNGSVFATGLDMPLQADVTDIDSYIARVEFRLNGSLFGVRTNAPWQLTLRNPPAGAYAIQATAWDDDGGVSTSAVVNINVAPRIASIESPAPHFAVLEFDSPARQAFELQATDVLVPPSWTNLMAFPAEANSRRLRVTNELPAGVETRFYRLLVP